MFYVLTANEGHPAGRPFGAIMEHGEELYITTSSEKDVYKQLHENKNMQIIALKPGTRNWVRVTGEAFECGDLKLKQKMFDLHPALHKHYASVNDFCYKLFRIRVISSEFK